MPVSALRRRVLLAAAAPLAVSGLAMPGIARAQSGAWPNRPVRIVVAFGTGGGTDITTRLIAPRLSEILGQPVVIENRPGAGSTIGADHVAKSPPDGTTFLLATLSTTGIAVGLYPNLPYDPAKDLVAVAPTVYVPIGLAITTAGWNVRTLPEFIDALKARPNAYTFGSAGIGTTGHIASANFLRQQGLQAEHAPYRNTGQTFTALAAGEVQFTHDIPSLLKPFHDAGRARVLFVASPERSPLLPEVPTVTEAGLQDYKAYSWYGVFGPAGLPQPIVDRMAAAIDQALGDAAVTARLNELGTPAMRGWTPERFAQYVRDEIALWGPLTRASGARVE
jgi:tripartite-type tricarboxylate transporter receptor subunit TctC